MSVPVVPVDLVIPVVPIPVAVVTLLGAFAPEEVRVCLRLSTVVEALVALEREGSVALTAELRPELVRATEFMPLRDIPWRPPVVAVA